MIDDHNPESNILEHSRGSVPESIRCGTSPTILFCVGDCLGEPVTALGEPVTVLGVPGRVFTTGENRGKLLKGLDA